MTLYCNDCNTLVEELPSNSEKLFMCPQCGKVRSYMEVHSIGGPICDAGPKNHISYYNPSGLEYIPQLKRYYITFLVGNVMERLIIDSNHFLDVLSKLRQDFDLSEATDLHISLITEHN